MLYFLTAWTALLVVCGVIGIALLQQLHSEHFVRAGDRFIAAEWMGLIVLAVSLLAVSLVFPLSPIVGLSVVLTLCSIALLHRPTRADLAGLFKLFSWRLLLLYFTAALLVASATVRPVTWVDSGLYHYGTVQWLAQYGTVTGIALVFSNLGFVSSWFALSAPFNPPVLEARVSAVVNGFVLMLVVLQLGIYLNHRLRGKAKPSDGFGMIFFGLMLLIVLLYSLFSDIAVSPSPDLPATFLVGVVPWSLLVIINSKSSASANEPKVIAQAQAYDRAIPLLLSAGAMTIKLTTISLLLISSAFYLTHYLRHRKRSIWQLYMGGAIGLVVLLPLLLAGIKASGCPLYPSSAFCVDVPWGQNGATIDAVAEGTHGWTNWYGAPPVGQNRLLWALEKWLQSDRANKGLVGMVGLTIVAFICSLKPLLNSSIRGKVWIVAIEGLGISFLMMTAPFFRFALPYLLLVPALLVMVWGEQLISPRLQKLPPLQHSIDRLLRLPPGENSDRSTGIGRITAIGSLTLIALTLTVFLHTHPAAYLLLPPPMQTVSVVKKQVNNLTYFSPEVEGELCWATPLPCGFEIEDVRLRDADRGLAGGFVRAD